MHFDAGPAVQAMADPARVLPPRLPRLEERQAARAALDALHEIGVRHDQRRKAAESATGQSLSRELSRKDLVDSRLVEPVSRLTPYPSVRVRCPSCHETMGFVAIDPFFAHGPQVLSANRRLPPKDRRGGAFDLVKLVRPQIALPNGAMVEDAAAGLGSVVPTPSGGWGDTFGLRREYRCRKCDWGPTAATNRHLLGLLLRAMEQGAGDLTLESESGANAWVGPIPDRGNARAWSTRSRRR
jgi:hypothetical protein